MIIIISHQLAIVGHEDGAAFFFQMNQSIKFKTVLRLWKITKYKINDTERAGKICSYFALEKELADQI